MFKVVKISFSDVWSGRTITTRQVWNLDRVHSANGTSNPISSYGQWLHFGGQKPSKLPSRFGINTLLGLTICKFLLNDVAGSLTSLALVGHDYIQSKRSTHDAYSLARISRSSKPCSWMTQALQDFYGVEQYETARLSPSIHHAWGRHRPRLVPNQILFDYLVDLPCKSSPNSIANICCKLRGRFLLNWFFLRLYRVL